MVVISSFGGLIEELVDVVEPHPFGQRQWVEYLQNTSVKKSLESDYPGPETPALRPIHGFATAISKKFQAAEP